MWRTLALVQRSLQDLIECLYLLGYLACQVPGHLSLTHQAYVNLGLLIQDLAGYLQQIRMLMK